MDADAKKVIDGLQSQLTKTQTEQQTLKAKSDLQVIVGCSGFGDGLAVSTRIRRAEGGGGGNLGPGEEFDVLVDGFLVPYNFPGAAPA